MAKKRTVKKTTRKTVASKERPTGAPGETSGRVPKTKKRVDSEKLNRDAAYLNGWKDGWRTAEDAIYVAKFESVDPEIKDPRLNGLIDGRRKAYEVASEYLEKYGATYYAEKCGELEEDA